MSMSSPSSSSVASRVAKRRRHQQDLQEEDGAFGGGEEESITPSTAAAAAASVLVPSTPPSLSKQKRRNIMTPTKTPPPRTTTTTNPRTRSAVSMLSSSLSSPSSPPPSIVSPLSSWPALSTPSPSASSFSTTTTTAGGSPCLFVVTPPPTKQQQQRDEEAGMPTTTPSRKRSSVTTPGEQPQPQPQPDSSPTPPTLIRTRIWNMLHNHGKKEQTATTPPPLEAEGTVCFPTQSGWCLWEGLTHICTNPPHDSENNGPSVLWPLVEKYGPPPFYGDSSLKGETGNAEYATFRSLCRIITGQQLAGAAAKTVWKRLVETVGGTLENPTALTPAAILAYEDCNAVETKLRQPAGLSNAKVRAVLDLARHYQRGELSDHFLRQSSNDDETIRSKLLAVKGLGPWSVDMFLLFSLEKPNVLPLGDLGVRKGTGQLFGIRGKGKHGTPCEKKDAAALLQAHEAFQPYRSLSTYYMWRCADIDAFNEDAGGNKKTASSSSSNNKKNNKRRKQETETEEEAKAT